MWIFYWIIPLFILRHLTHKEPCQQNIWRTAWSKIMIFWHTGCVQGVDFSCLPDLCFVQFADSSGQSLLWQAECHAFIYPWNANSPAPKTGFCGSRNWLPGSEIATGCTSSRGLHHWALHLLKSPFLFIEKASNASSSNICLMLNLLICSYKHCCWGLGRSLLHPQSKLQFLTVIALYQAPQTNLTSWIAFL